MYHQNHLCIYQWRQNRNEILSDVHNAIIFGDEHFQTKKKLIQNRVCIARKENYLVSAINMFDTNVTINKGEIISTTISCDYKTRDYLDKTFCVDETKS